MNFSQFELSPINFYGSDPLFTIKAKTSSKSYETLVSNISKDDINNELTSYNYEIPVSKTSEIQDNFNINILSLKAFIISKNFYNIKVNIFIQSHHIRIAERGV